MPTENSIREEKRLSAVRCAPACGSEVGSSSKVFSALMISSSDETQVQIPHRRFARIRNDSLDERGRSLKDIHMSFRERLR